MGISGGNAFQAVGTSRGKETEAEVNLICLRSGHVPQWGRVISYKVRESAVAAIRKNGIITKFKKDE